ncbi:hypothetical protein ACFSQD_13945 [Flavihumibacter stibioxidans]|uniref:HTH deoR-type domain-containing protein n=1 Tax=Flavihumibacter stibioxidans TaxID=1834163 RepID=A0ABR7M8D9_9BACT|nr:hypothetical protein [Flavihumibacter stibioxidans]MBC6491295.1 hypothetical protein [Flavihumibacter stibioxidans]
MAKVRRNLLTENTSGAVGKVIVFKQFNNQTLATKYPDRSAVKLTISQQSCQNIFREAVAFASSVMADQQRHQEWVKKLSNKKSTRGTSVYHAVIQDYMKRNSPKAREEKVIAALENWHLLHWLSDRQMKGMDFLLRYHHLSHSIYKDLNEVSKPTATRDLQDLVAKGLLKVSGRGAGTCYTLPAAENEG